MEKWHELISQPIHKTIADRDVFVEMRDGVRIAVDVHRPDADGKFPVLIAMSPFSKDSQAMPIPPQPPGKPLWDGSLEAGNTDYLVSRGYVHIVVDVRGTGKSEGEYLNLFSKDEVQDGYELVEWAARQEWCDGNVGMVGISYFAIIQYLVAALQPPHLKAIFPFDGWTDLYRDIAYHGGLCEVGFWAPYLWGATPAKSRVPATSRETSSEEFKCLVDKAKANEDVKINPFVARVAANPHLNPVMFDFLVHPVDGPFWGERSAYTKFDKIKVPSFLGAPWDGYNLHLPGAFSAFLGINAPKKLLISPPPDYERPWYEYHDLVVRWYDHWLKGIDTGMMDEPPIKIWVMGTGGWRYENEWPLARTRWTKFYLRSWGRLSAEPAIYRDEPPYYDQPDCFVHQVVHTSSEVQSVSYLTSPMPQDMEVTGPIALYLYAAIDQDDTNWIVTLKDVAPHGAEIILTQGWLKASHRALDESKSRPWQPYHPHTERVPVVPGEINQYAIAVQPTSNLFKRDHRIKLEINSSDWKGTYTHMEHHFYHLPSSKITLHKIYHDKEHPSYLLIPVITDEGKV